MKEPPVAQVPSSQVAIFVVMDARIVLHDYRQSPLVGEGPHSLNQRPSYDPFGVFGAIDAVCRCLAERTLEVVSEGWCAW